MRILILASAVFLIACGGGGDEPAPTDPGTGTNTGSSTGTAGGPTGATTGSTTGGTTASQGDFCEATIHVDWDEDGVTDRLRFEKWAPFPDQPTLRVDHYTDDPKSATIRRDWWDWDANGNNVEYARDDYNNGVVDVWTTTTFDSDNLPLVAWSRTDGVERELHHMNANGRVERTDVDEGADGSFETYILYTYDGYDRLTSIITYDATTDAQGAVTTLQYMGAGLDRTLRIDPADGSAILTRFEVFDGDHLIEVTNEVNGVPLTNQTWVRDADGWWTETVDRTFGAGGNLLTTRTQTRARGADGFMTDTSDTLVTAGKQIPDAVTLETWTWECTY